MLTLLFYILKFKFIVTTRRNLQILRRLSVGPVGNPCHLPPAAGNCEGICPRWYFDTRLGSCRPFNYGCCGGNANNFKTKGLCEENCGRNIGRLYNFLSYDINVLKNHRLSLCFDKMLGYSLLML